MQNKRKPTPVRRKLAATRKSELSTVSFQVRVMNCFTKAKLNDCPKSWVTRRANGQRSEHNHHNHNDGNVKSHHEDKHQETGAHRSRPMIIVRKGQGH